MGTTFFQKQTTKTHNETQRHNRKKNDKLNHEIQNGNHNKDITINKQKRT